MTPTEFITAARRKYNAVSDTFFADAEILDLLYQVETEMAKYALTIESTDNSTTTVAGTRSYAIPTRCIAINRLTYDGQKLKKYSFREDDEITLFDEGTTDQGTPLYYAFWGDNVYLRPIPDDAKTLNFYYYKEPAVITVAGTIETPSRYHMDLVDGVVAEMAFKDMEYAAGDRYRARFETHMIEARKWQRKRQRSDSLGYVKDEESMMSTVLGPV